MNPLYQQLAHSLEGLGQRMCQWEQQFDGEPGEAADIAEKIRQSVAQVKDGIWGLQQMLKDAARKTEDGVPSEWDLVSVVPADQGDPEEAEQRGVLPEVTKLGEVFTSGMDGFERLKELLKTYSRHPLDRRLAWAEEVEEMGKEFHRIYQLSRDAHDANWHDRYY